MTKYLETLIFIGKCLTISVNYKNKIIVKNKIINKKIDWEYFIKVSSSHLLIPSLYYNFKNTNLIDKLPLDLSNFMKSIYKINYDRNEKILIQIKELNKILKKNDILPIFLKGASFLIEDLYLNKGERMIGDIDFIVSNEDYFKSIKILKKHGYSSNIKEQDIIFPSKHYPKMVKKDRIAAIEIHSKIILKKHSKIYNYESFLSKNRIINNMNIPSIENQIIHNFLNKQFSDRGKYLRNPNFRNTYDLFRLSLKKQPLKIIKKNKILFNTFNSYLLQSYYLLKQNELNYYKNFKSKIELKIFILLIKNNKINIIYNNVYYFLRKFKIRFILIIQLIYKSKYRNYFFRKYKINLIILIFFYTMV
ncbi:nucleotidyltransferase family protein [Polaribacter marinivivus]|uniref:Nucleotidyltransferase family protein n=1 Tax=Polaribacter marinivivus TaxID=1524260 RepID=A0ABV8REK4_9FLAO